MRDAIDLENLNQLVQADICNQKVYCAQNMKSFVFQPTKPVVVQNICHLWTDKFMTNLNT